MHDASFLCAYSDITEWCELSSLARQFGHLRGRSVRTSVARVVLLHFATQSLQVALEWLDEGSAAGCVCVCVFVLSFAMRHLKS